MKKLEVVNPADKSWTKNRYILCFGAYGWTKLLAYANSLDDALDECIDWIAENAPGLLCDEQVAEAYNEALASGMDEDSAWDEALADVTTGGNCGNHILSYEWGIVAENPDKKTIIEIAKETK